ncbi:hypothetical protein BKA70DRAFT_1033074, partial [Coprinopsis sp. MPI-PUGE-AT-0042]
RRCKEDPLYKCGQRIARSIHPYKDLKKFVLLEVRVQRALEIEGQSWRETAERDRKDHELYRYINEAILSSGEDLLQSNLANQKHILSLISKGQMSAIRADLAMLGSLLPLWMISYGGSVETGQCRSWQRGFDNEITGGLLCPVQLNWLDSSVKNHLRSQPQALLVNQWPRILFQDLSYDVKEPWEGFLKNNLLIKVGSQVYISAYERN